MGIRMAPACVRSGVAADQKEAVGRTISDVRPHGPATLAGQTRGLDAAHGRVPDIRRPVPRRLVDPPDDPATGEEWDLKSRELAARLRERLRRLNRTLHDRHHEP